MSPRGSGHGTVVIHTASVTIPCGSGHGAVVIDKVSHGSGHTYIHSVSVTIPLWVRADSLHEDVHGGTPVSVEQMASSSRLQTKPTGRVFQVGVPAFGDKVKIRM